MEEHMLGHNNPPSAIDDALTPYGDAITEAEGWLDGTEVTTEGQMKAVDMLIKEIKAAKKAVEAAEESEAKPIYDAWKAAKDRYKPTLTDLDRIVKGLVATVDAFKRRLAAEKEADRKKAEAEAWEATRKAQEAARQAAETDIEAQRAAAQHGLKGVGPGGPHNFLQHGLTCSPGNQAATFATAMPCLKDYYS